MIRSRSRPILTDTMNGPASRDRRLRVAVMNVQSGAATTRGWWEYLQPSRREAASRLRRIEAIGHGLDHHGVDLAILLEIDGGSGRTGGIDQAAAIARHGSLPSFCFFPCFRLGEEINQGNAVHAAAGVTMVENHPLSGIGEPRFLSEAAVSWAGEEIHVFVAHTSLKGTVRRTQLEEIRAIVASRHRPVLLGGDFNARKSRELDELSATLHRVATGLTFPSWRPRWALDHLFVSAHFRTESAKVLTELREADHLAVIADLTLGGRRAEPTIPPGP
jgi:endonuclease/exonuclease/phosphatase family metal-dependent hydrolase